MRSFKEYYGGLFEALGYPLTERSGTAPAVVATAEKRLGVRIPAALREYFLVAGNERRFNCCHNRLLAPKDWSIDKQHLLFLEENQGVLWWGVSVRNPKANDPAIYQGMNDEPIAWHLEHRKCSVFLAVMLHYHGVSGGFPSCGQGDAPERTDYRFEKHGWTFHGEVNSLMAYSRQGQAVCLTPPCCGDRWLVLAGAKSNASLKAIGAEIGVSFS